MKNKIFKEEKSFKEDIDKLKSEKEDLVRQLSKTQTKETKWKYEIKKKEIELNDIKNKLRKYMNDKDIISNSMSTNGTNVNMKINQTLNNINYATPSKEVLISFENLIKNSNTVLMNVNHLKEFYNLLFQAFNEKINYITNENNDLRECYKIILREINKYMDFKKLLLQKLSKDALTNNKINKNENVNNKVNEGLLNMDFNESREQILNNFNEILNSFRYVLIYDLLKVDPNKEFNYDEMTKQITNTKYDLKSLPYYKEIADLMENFDVNALKTLKNTLDNLDMETQELEKKNEEINYDVDVGDINTEELINDNKSLQILQDINKDFSDTLNFLDEKISVMKEKMDRNNIPQ
jgi:DNA repair exonuclease SbcCD ATPase subunit